MDTEFDLRGPVTDSMFVGWLISMGVDVIKESLEDLKARYKDNFYSACVRSSNLRHISYFNNY